MLLYRSLHRPELQGLPVPPQWLGTQGRTGRGAGADRHWPSSMEELSASRQV